MARVAVVGTGVIGAGMAVNLLRNGHEVVVWNRTAEHAADAVAAGAPLARRRRPRRRCGRRVRGDCRRRVLTIGVARRRRHPRRIGRVGRLVTSATLSPAGSPSSPTPAATAGGRSSTSPSRAAVPGPREARWSCSRVVIRRASRRSTRCSRRSRRGVPLRAGRQRHEVQARAQRPAGDPPRRIRRGDGAGSRRRARPRRGRSGARRPSRRPGHPDGVGGRSAAARDGRTSPCRGLSRICATRGDGGRRTSTDARRRGARLAAAADEGWGDRDWTVANAVLPGTTSPLREGLTARFGDCVGSRSWRSSRTPRIGPGCSSALSGVRVRRHRPCRSTTCRMIRDNAARGRRCSPGPIPGIAREPTAGRRWSTPVTCATCSACSTCACT